MMMFIESVLLVVETNKNMFRRFVTFTKNNKVNEFNMIFGENTLGKSTFIQSVVFALKGEDIYGLRKKDILNMRNLFKTFYKQKASRSHVYLQLVNNDGKRVVVVRNVMNWEDPVTVFFGVELEKGSSFETLLKQSVSHSFYKMRKENHLRGNETYQEFLFSFMNIVPIKDNAELSQEDEENTGTKLLFYIQNLMPLFVIQQGAWHDIQAINPRYGISDIKKTSFEVILNLSGTEIVKLKYELDRLQYQLKQKTTSLKDIQDVIGMRSLKDSQLIDMELANVNKEIQSHHQKIESLEMGASDDVNVIQEIRKQFAGSSLKARRYRDRMNGLEREIREYDFYINKILNDIEKNDKLKTAKKIIGIIPVDTCPHCLSTVIVDTDEELHNDSCGLCGSTFKQVSYSQNDKYLGYLKDELKDFIRLKEQKEAEIKNLYSKIVEAELEQAELKRAMNDFEEKLKPKNLQAYNFHSREIGRLENEVKRLGADRELVIRYEAMLTEKETIMSDIKEKKAQIKAIEKQNERDQQVIQYFEDTFKMYLKELDFLKMGLDLDKIKDDKKNGKTETLQEVYDQIVIDRFDYLPKIEERNLYYLTSNSGLIRIILAYYTALLKTALKYADSVQHPFLLILDEPRQQNIDMQTFNSFLKLFGNLREEHPGKFEVIVASSEKGNVSQGDIALDLGKDIYLLEPDQV